MPIHGYPGNVITANPTAPTSSVASGVWTTEQQLIAKAAGNWPFTIPTQQISLSARFNSADSAYLNRTLTTPTNNLKWTWSGWVKRSGLTAANYLFCAGDGTSNNSAWLTFNATDGINFYQLSGGSYNLQMTTSAVFRDPSAWYHIVLIYDSANATSTNRVQIYVNGVLQAVTYAVGPFAQNTTSRINSAIAHYIAKLDYTTLYFNGYLTEVNFIDGQALTPSSFGQINASTGVWEPISYTGTYGTNGFYLPFNKEGVSVDFLVVAGGGGGGGGASQYSGGGGGGAGGLLEATGVIRALGVAYTVTVGAGGSAGNGAGTGLGGYGSDSYFGAAKGFGGGGGSNGYAVSAIAQPTSGGSGGGGYGYSGAGLSGGASTQTSNNGGTGYGNSGGGTGGVSGPASGGGGAGAAVSSGTTTGGAGRANSISGSSVTYAGGGGGAGSTASTTGGSGGSGGGGAGRNFSTSTAGGNGTANLGGGGGGGGGGVSNTLGGTGGSGVVIIKIPSTYTATFSGGVTQTSITSGGFKIYTVTATSTTSETVTFS